MRVSASQIVLYRNCQRAWAWSYVTGLKTTNKAAELGSAVHTELERYLLGGDLDFTTEAGEIAASGLEHLPLPGTPGMVIEGEFTLTDSNGHTYLGYKDVELSVVDDCPHVIIDHKSTSDLKWAKTPDDLRKDPQAIIYAADAFAKRPDLDTVELKWIYYQTRKTRKSAATHLVITRDHVAKEFLAIEKTVEEMSMVQEASVGKEASTFPLELTPNTKHCGAFGGCPYQSNCNLSPLDKMRAHMANALLEKLKANKAAHATPVNGVNGVNGHATYAAINPPEFQPPPAPAASAPAAPPPAAPPVPAATKEGDLPFPAADAAVAEPPKRGRGRPRKNPVAPVPPNPGVNEGQAALIAAAKAKEAPAPAPSATRLVSADKIIGTLYINCGPVGGEYLDANHIIASTKKRMRAEGVEDYRFIDFGKGTAAFVVTALEELISLGSASAVRIDLNTPEAGLILSDLMANAKMVVR